MHLVVQVVLIRLHLVGGAETDVPIDHPRVFGIDLHAGVHPVVTGLREYPGIGDVVVHPVREVPVGVLPGDAEHGQRRKRLVGEVQVHLRNLADLEFRDEAESGQPPGADAQVGAEVDRFVQVHVQADAGLVGLALLAVENERVGLLRAADPVGDRLEGLRAVQGGEDPLDLFPAVQAVPRQQGGADDVVGFLFGDAHVLDIPDSDLLLRQVDGRAAFRR